MTLATEITTIWLVFLFTAVATSGVAAQGNGAVVQRAVLSVADATRIALTRYPGADVLEVEHDTEAGRDVYEVELRDRGGVEHELVIDADNGLIVREDD